MSYFKKPLSSLGLTVTDIPQPLPGTPATPAACPAGQVKNDYGYCIPASAAQSTGFLSDLFKALTPTPAAPTAPVVAAAPSGISPTTLALLGGGAILLIVLLTRKD